jgi:hypothetical protein
MVDASIEMSDVDLKDSSRAGYPAFACRKRNAGSPTNSPALRPLPKVEECPIGVYGVIQIAWRAASQILIPGSAYSIQVTHFFTI